MEQKRSIPEVILVYYINTGNFSKSNSHELLYEMSEVINQNCEQYEGMYNIILPIQDGETRVECIHPKFVSEQTFEDYTNLGYEFEEIIKEKIKNWKKPNEE